MKSTVVVVAAGLLAGLGCQMPPPAGEQVVSSGSESKKRQRPIYLVDRHGDRFDITHAVHKYGLQKRGFQYGIGKRAFRTINQPDMLEDGQVGYPTRGQTSLDILGAYVEGEARSYSIGDIVRHEIVNETIGHTQAAVAYWPLVDLAAVYSRQLDDQVLTLRPSGWTYRNTFVLYDEETETLWYPLPGTEGLTGVSGPLADRVLPEIESTRTSWKQWKSEHPTTKFMDYPFSNSRWGR